VWPRLSSPGLDQERRGRAGDEANGLLYACETDLSAMPYVTDLRSFDLATGKAKQSYPIKARGSAMIWRSMRWQPVRH